MPLDLIRRCKVDRVADQAQDNGRYLQSSYEKEDKEVKIDWDEQEVADLRALMDPVLSCTHRWVDVQHQKLKEQNIAMTFNLETRTKGEASASENTSHYKGSKRKEGPEKRESSKKKQKVNLDHPSSASSRHEKEISQGEDQREKVYEIDESMESTVQNDKQDKGRTPQHSSRQSLSLQVGVNEQQGERNDDEATSPFRGERPLPEEVQVREGKSSIPDWLKERLTRVVVVEEEEQVFDLESLLGKSQEGIERKKATKISKVIRDDTGSRKIQIATPMVDKYDDEIMAEEYDLETFDLGSLTFEQAMEDVTDSVRAVNNKLKEEVEKNRRLEKRLMLGGIIVASLMSH